MLNRSNAALVALICSLLVSNLCLAADEPEPDLEDEIIVYATRVEQSARDVPAAIEIINQEEVQLGRQQLGLDESLLTVPGLFIQDRFNFAQDLRIAIRGFGARSNFGIRGVKIIVDDIPATLPDGQGQVDAIDLGSIDQIEVLKGPVSSLYGNASGGAINIVSEAGPEQPFVEGRLTLGAYDFNKSHIKLGGETGKLNYLVSASHLEYVGYRDHSNTRNTQINSRWEYAINNKSSLRVILNSTDQPIANDPGGINLDQATVQPSSARDRNVLFRSGEALDQQKLGLVYSHQFNAEHSLKVRNYYVWRDFANRLPFEGGGAVEIDRTFAGVGLVYSIERAAGNRWLLGLDYDRQDDDRRRFDNISGTLGDLVFDQNERVDSIGLFAQGEFNVHEQLKLTLGVRYDEIEFDARDRFLINGDDSGTRRLQEVSPTLGALFAVRPNLQIFANYSASFETPTTTEFANPSGAGGFNPDLDPQFAKSTELGVRGAINASNSFALSVFHIDIDDELIPFELDSQPGRDFFENAGSSNRNGVELSWRSQVTDQFQFGLAYTHSDFTFDQFVDANNNDFSGNRTPGVPKSQLHAELKYTGLNGIYGAVDYLSVSDVYLNNANSALESSYSVSNLRLGYTAQFNDWTISPFFGVNNLFDQSYFSNLRINAFGGRFYEPAPERHVYAGIGVRFSPQR